MATIVLAFTVVTDDDEWKNIFPNERSDITADLDNRLTEAVENMANDCGITLDVQR